MAKVEKKELIEYLQIRFMIECYILETEIIRHARAVIEKLKVWEMLDKAKNQPCSWKVETG